MARNKRMEIKKAANKVKYISEEYTRDCMFKRNRHLVDNSSVCVAYLTESRGGTAYTVGYAREKCVRVINLAEQMNETPYRSFERIRERV